MNADSGDLLDVNVWLALAAPSHAHHVAARDNWMQPRLPRTWFDRVTMLALSLVRLLCEPKVMGDAKLSMSRAMDVYEHFASLPEVGFMDEPTSCGSVLAAMAHAPGRSPRVLTDLYLASFAQAGRLRIVTFDRDFERLAQCTVLRLAPPAQ